MEKITIKQLCEHIEKAEILKNAEGRKPTAEQIFAYSPTGELSNIFEWYELACEKLGTTATGQNYIKPDYKELFTGNFLANMGNGLGEVVKQDLVAGFIKDVPFDQEKYQP